MRFLFLLALVACDNKAITYAKMLDRNADCASVKNGWTQPDDVAVCRVGSEVWKCEVRTYVAECQTVRVIPAEAPKGK